MPIDEITFECEEKMEGAVAYLREELRGIRTGRASAGMVDHVKVDYYGSPTDLRQLANIAVPEPTMIIIKPFDPGSIKEIERAIQAANLGIQPMSDGKVIRLSVPPLSGERREQLAGQVRKTSETTRVAIRNARRDANKQVEKEQKDSILTEDEADKGKVNIQELTNKYEAKITELVEAKTTEIREI